MKRPIKLTLIILFIIFFTPVWGMLTGRLIVFYDKGMAGQVVDVETKKPIEGAIIVVMWKLTQVPGGGSGGYAKVSEEVTDKEGKFKISWWIRFLPHKVLTQFDDSTPHVVIYKPGYKVYVSSKVLRDGWPDNDAMTKEEKEQLKEEKSLTPAKLKRIYTDKERFENYDEWETKASFPDVHFSKEQSRIIFNALEDEISKVSDTNKEKHILLQSIKIMRERWGGNKK